MMIEDELKDRWLLAQIKKPRKTDNVSDEDYYKMFIEGR